MEHIGQPALLSVQGLTTQFRGAAGPVNVIEDISFDVVAGRTLAIVGESGSGKSVANLSIMRLLDGSAGRIVAGRVLFEGRDLVDLPEREMTQLRGNRISMIFQDPMTSLNPYLPISTQMTEVTRRHLGHSRIEAAEHAARMLDMVGIPDARRRLKSYPHEFSGGMQQRVMIAMAISCRPQLLIADEPTTALDVTIQAQILELLKDLQSEMGIGMILISHDLGVVAEFADDVIVMYAGRVFERAPTRELFTRPANPYTIGLLRSIPSADRIRGGRLFQIPGMAPDLSEWRSGCPFAPRCDRVSDVCRLEFPPMVKVAEQHDSLCHFADDLYLETKKGPGEPEPHKTSMMVQS